MAQNLMAASSGLPSVLVSSQLAAVDTTLYTCPAASAMKVAQATIMNTGSAEVLITINLVKTGGVVDATSRIASFVIGAGDSRMLTELVGHFLGPGDFISANAATAALVTLTVSGVVFS